MRRPVLSAIFTIVVGLSLAGAAFAQEVPRLEIPVPGLELSPIIRGNEEITIPWLAQYIEGAYTFLISIVGLVAAVVMIVGGFQYVTSAGDKSRIGAAKKRIANAFVGMVLVFGSYTLLYAINPDLTAFDGLKVLGVTTDYWHDNFDATLSETEEVTADETGATASFDTSVFDDYQSLPACPFTLTGEKGSKTAKLEFYSRIQTSGVITATSKRNKVLQIAAVADACDVNLGSCGATAGAINALAGVGSTACLADASSCNDDSKGPEMFSISARQRREIYGRNCALWSETKIVNGNCIKFAKVKGKNKCIEYEKIPLAEKTRRTLVSVWKKYTPDSAAKALEVKDNCFHKNSDAKAKIREYLEDEARDGRLKGWPEAWTKQLNPGDRLVVYNGNNDLVGAHAVIFVGWASEGNMKVVQGGNGGAGNQRDVTRPGTICVTSKCGKNYTPLINGWRPE